MSYYDKIILKSRMGDNKRQTLLKAIPPASGTQSTVLSIQIWAQRSVPWRQLTVRERVEIVCPKPHYHIAICTFSKAKLLHAVTVRLKDSYISLYILFGEMAVQLLLMGISLELIVFLKHIVFRTIYCPVLTIPEREIEPFLSCILSWLSIVADDWGFGPSLLFLATFVWLSIKNKKKKKICHVLNRNNVF